MFLKIVDDQENIIVIDGFKKIKADHNWAITKKDERLLVCKKILEKGETELNHNHEIIANEIYFDLNKYLKLKNKEWNTIIIFYIDNGFDTKTLAIDYDCRAYLMNDNGKTIDTI